MILLDGDGTPLESLTMLVTESEILQLMSALRHVSSHMDEHEQAMGDIHGGTLVDITIGGYAPGVVSGLAAGSEPLAASIAAEVARGDR
jgi:hypothetical protein